MFNGSLYWVGWEETHESPSGAVVMSDHRMQTFFILMAMVSRTPPTPPTSPHGRRCSRPLGFGSAVSRHHPSSGTTTTPSFVSMQLNKFNKPSFDGYSLSCIFQKIHVKDGDISSFCDLKTH